MTPVLRSVASGRQPDALDHVLLSLADHDVAVVGAGKSGVSAARLLRARGARRVVILDDKSDVELKELARTLAGEGLELAGGGIKAEVAASSHLVVMSPGVPRRNDWWEAMQAQGTPWMGEAELAYRLTTAPWVCITGTNGKSTTTTLVGRLFQEARDEVFVGGNLGTPVCGAARSDAAWAWLVVEMSSYQCEGLSSLDARVAVLTNLTPDHLERYVVTDAYYGAKMRLFRGQSPDHHAVLNATCAESLGRGASLACRRLDFAVPGGARGVEIRGKDLLLTWEHGTERFLASNPALRGRHNLENAAAAVAAARAAEVPAPLVQAGLDAFVAVPHRLQEIGSIDGVAYFNDSKGTNVDATVKAILAFEEPIHLIAGGLDKGAPYGPLAEAARGRVKACYVIGAAAPLIGNAMEPVCPVVDAGTLESALEQARGAAKPGEVVVLSPACASFDQFKNYEHRGEVFTAWVRARAGGPG
jgi:UDP-N-acetylmuramoylalanine--D-glutamate ligase